MRFPGPISPVPDGNGLGNYSSLLRIVAPSPAKVTRRRVFPNGCFAGDRRFWTPSVRFIPGAFPLAHSLFSDRKGFRVRFPRNLWILSHLIPGQTDRARADRCGPLRSAASLFPFFTSARREAPERRPRSLVVVAATSGRRTAVVTRRFSGHSGDLALVPKTGLGDACPARGPAPAPRAADARPRRPAAGFGLPKRGVPWAERGG